MTQTERELLEALKSFLRAPSVGSAGPGSITIVVQEFNMRAANAAIAKAEQAELVEPAKPVAWYIKEHGEIVDLEWYTNKPNTTWGDWKPLYTTQRAAARGAQQAAVSERVEPAYPDEWAKFLHYPDCWDTAAYPTLKDAIHEVLACSECSVCKPAASMSEAEHVAPVAWIVPMTIDGKDVTPFYTTPPAAVSEPLSDAEIDELSGPFPLNLEEWDECILRSFARAIEAAHNIRSE
jgi:hypothetical protein